MTYQAFDIIDTKSAVGPVRASLMFARSDAYRHQTDTGRDAFVVEMKTVWTTQTLDAAIIDADPIYTP